MTTETLTELQAFRAFLDRQIAEGRTDLSPEDSLALCQSARDELRDSVAAVLPALADMHAGDSGQPLREFVDEFRKKNDISADA